MSNNDRSNEALFARRAKAEAATPGPWEHRRKRFYGDEEETSYVGAGSRILLLANPGTDERNIAFCAVNDPGTVIEDINEILRLRSLVQEHEEYIANLELEAKSVDKKIGDIAAILGITPDAGNMRIPGYIKDEILRLKAENARLDREADWLAQEVSLWEHDQLDGTGADNREVPELREQARKAVDKASKDSKGE